METSFEIGVNVKATVILKRKMISGKYQKN
jgi:hypothetical protein